MGFMARQSAFVKAKIQLVVALAEESQALPGDALAGADALFLPASKFSSGAEAINKMSQLMPEVPFGLWLPDSRELSAEEMAKINCDFVVFPAMTTPLKLFENNKAGKILELEASVSDVLLRTANELPVDAVLINHEDKGDYLLTWQHLMLFQRFAALLAKPLLARVSSNVTAAELKALWQGGVDAIVVEVGTGSPAGKLTELRRVIDQTDFPFPRKRQKAEARLSYPSLETKPVTCEEEEEEEDE